MIKGSHMTANLGFLIILVIVKSNQGLVYGMPGKILPLNYILQPKEMGMNYR